MMADFAKANSRTSKNEGGFQCDHDDNGNWTGGKIGVGDLIGTKYGISAPLLCAYLKRKATKEDMLNLKKETALRIYKREYWDPVRGDEIIDQEQAEELYDMAVNAGVGTAINIMQARLGLPQVAVMTKTTLDKMNYPV